MKTFKQFNESLRDKMTSKPLDDIMNSLSKHHTLKQVRLITQHGLDKKYMPSDEEIERGFAEHKMGIKSIIDFVNKNDLDPKFYPSEEEIAQKYNILPFDKDLLFNEIYKKNFEILTYFNNRWNLTYIDDLDYVEGYNKEQNFYLDLSEENVKKMGLVPTFFQAVNSMEWCCLYKFPDKATQDKVIPLFLITKMAYRK